MAENLPDDPLTTDGLVGSGYTRTARRGAGGPSGASLSGIYALLGLAVLGLAVLGWFAFRAQTEIDALKSQDQSSSLRLGEIETRLQITDEDRSRADTEIEGQIDFWEDEIRKLWDLSNGRNRDWITQNQNSLKSQQTKITEISKEVDNLNAAVSRVETGLEKQQEILNRIDLVSRQVTEFGRLVRDSTDKANTASITLARMESELSKLLEENAEFQASVDSFRRQVNTRIEELRGQIRSAESGPTPSIDVVEE